MSVSDVLFPLPPARPAPGPDPGAAEEPRVVLEGVGWPQYRQIDAALEGRRCVRLRYLDGKLEIMTISARHETASRLLGHLVTAYLLGLGVPFVDLGSATLVAEDRRASCEPDASFVLRPPKSRPDLVIEVALTSGGSEKLESYRRFGVPEVWIWRAEELEIFVLAPDAGSYARAARSALLPALDLATLARCARRAVTSEALAEFRRALAGAS